MAGIFADRYLVVDVFWLLVIAGACGTLWLVLDGLGRSRVAAGVLLVLPALAGGLHHHLVWHALPAADIEHLLTDDPVLLRCQGRVVRSPVVYPPEERFSNFGPPSTEETWLRIEVQSVVTRGPGTTAPPRDGRSTNGQQTNGQQTDGQHTDGQQADGQQTDSQRADGQDPDGQRARGHHTAEHHRKTCGRLTVVVTGTAEAIHVGDRIDVQGWARRIRPLQNPGGYDVLASNRQHGVRGRIKVRHPRLIQIVQRSGSWIDGSRRFLRQRAEAVLETGLPDDLRSVADAMLLGDRSLLHRDIRAAFVESGAMHLLAISGLHIGILMFFLLIAGRALRLSRQNSLLLALAILFVYLQIADCRPPMVRAFLIIFIGSLGQLFRRRAFSANSLAAAAIVILALNPASLFDVGSQLSFLAVWVIFWVMTVTRREGEPDIAVAGDGSDPEPSEPLNSAAETGAEASSSPPDSPKFQNVAAGPSVLESSWNQMLKSGFQTILKGWSVSGAIWIISAPLVLHVFNVVAPVGLLINVLLIPVVGTGLCFGFLALFVGMVSTTLAAPLIAVFGWFLRGLMSVADLAAAIEFGHAYLPGPPAWWLCGFYAIVAVAMLISLRQRRPDRVLFGMSLWILFGVTLLPQGVTLLPQSDSQQPLRCTFLSVGHGLSVIVETPSDRTIVYDSGSRHSGEYPAEVLCQALWSRGISKIDALVVSHADFDHYSGIVPLMKLMPVGKMFCSRHFIAADQHHSIMVTEHVLQNGVPLELISRGDRILIDGDVRIDVLHPAANSHYESDNAASTVIQINGLAKRILLTGDLDDNGLHALLQQPSRQIDILLAPHHGESGANPKSLADWANPEVVVASSPHRFNAQQLTRTYGPDCRVYSTSDHGAVTIEITPDAALQVHPFVDSSTP